MNCRECEALLVEALYGELDDEERGRFEAHVASCPDCAQTWGSLSATLEVMNRRERPDPGQAYWEGFYNRLSARMEREEAERRSRSWLGRLFPGMSDASVRWAYRAVLAAALIAFGALAGRLIIPGPGPSHERDGDAKPPEVAVSEKIPGPALAEACARQYIEDSQVLLLALVNFDPGTGEGYATDWTAEKNRSRELVNQAASLKADLTEPKQRRLRELVAELELIMLQIANLENTGDLEAVDLIRGSVEDRGVLLKINLEKMRSGEVAEPAPEGCDA